MSDQKPIRILFAEDRPEDMEMACSLLKANAMEVLCVRTETRQSFLEQLERFNPDLIISDYSMPEFDGITALKLALKYAPGVPVIIFTGSINEQTAVECMKSGAMDYVLKDNMTRLPFAVQEALEKRRIMAAQAETLEALRASEEKFRYYINHAPVAFVIADREGRFVECNVQAENLFGYKVDELRRLAIPDLLSPASFETGIEHFRKVREEGFAVSEVMLKRKDESLLWTVITAVRLTDDRFMAYCQDISDRKQAEIRLLESDRLKSAFLANISHEVRTPLNGILGFTELLLDSDISHDEMKHYQEVISNSAAQLLHIIQDIVEVSRIEAGQVMVRLHDCDLPAMLMELKSYYLPQANLKQLELTFESVFPDNLPLFYTDDWKFRQIMMNLISNALKFTEKGKVMVRSSLAGTQLKIEVTDTGIGIAPELLPVIFEHFRQVELEPARKYGGTGLGLTLSKAFAEMLGGHISVESVPGQGSSFIVEIPFRTGSGKPAISKAFTGQPGISKLSLTGRTILIAEDDEKNSYYFNRVLSRSGAELLMAANGSIALELFRSHPGVDMVLMDLKMPVMDGFEAVREIRKINSDVPIIALTAYNLSDEENKVMQEGFNDYLSKPVTRTVLTETILKYLSKTRNS